ncbi:MAG: hypothetical protein FWD09_06390 [Lentimicrobiaceae bacterium]|nr:hypothetical protein [Lentimicrobiaceae bacterium]
MIVNQKLLKLTAFLLFLIVALASSCQPEGPKEIEYTISAQLYKYATIFKTKLYNGS